MVVILALMKEFSGSPLRLSPRPGLGWGEGEKDEGENGKGTKRMVVGEGRGKEISFSRIKAFFNAVSDFFPALSDMFAPGVL